MSKVSIGKHLVGDGCPCFVIAEVGINHNGSLKTVFDLIDVAVKAGCNAVKFQKRTVEIVYSISELIKQRSVDQTIILAGLDRGVFTPDDISRIQKGPDHYTNGDLKRVLEFSPKEFVEIADYCKKKSIMWSVSPWDENAVDEMKDFDLPFIKVASASLTDDSLLRKIRTCNVPVILSTGMSTMEEVRHAVEVLGRNDLILLHTVATYPAMEEDLNLSVMGTLEREFPGVPIGYSGHERGTTLSVAAVAMGACVVERHITLDRTMPGSDQAASLEPEGISRVVNNIRRLEKAVGSPEKKLLSVEEPIKKKLRRIG